MSKQDKISVDLETLETMTVSGAINVLYLDPVDREVYLFRNVGPARPMQAFDGPHIRLGAVDKAVTAEGLREHLEARAEALTSLIDEYWDGERWNMEDYNEQEQLLDLENLPRRWDPADWFVDGVGELVEQIASGDTTIDEAAQAEVDAAAPDAALDVEEVRTFLEERFEALPLVPSDGTWVTPPECRGPVAEVSYMQRDGCGYRRTLNLHTGAVRHERALLDEYEEWDPANWAPDVEGWELARVSA